MARGSTLLKLLNSYRVETRASLNPAHNAQVRDMQVAILQRVQERLWEDFTWPHLRVERQVALSAGQRYYETPADMLVDRIEKLECFRDGCWRELTPGFDGGEYGWHNSDLDERAYPPRRWKIREGEDVEIWPISDTNSNPTTLEGTLRFTGIRNLGQLVDDGDRADLDGNMIVMYAAAEELARSGSKDAQFKLDAANKIYARLRGNLSPRRSVRMFGIGAPQPPRRLTIGRYVPPST